MKLSRRAFHRLLVGTLGGVALPAFATGLVAGRDYVLIEPPQSGEIPGAIEVLEFFSYACPYCQSAHPLVKAWAETLPADVTVRAVPVSFGRAAWAALARLHHALALTGDLPRLESAIFRAIHQERVRLFTEQAITTWVAEQGVDTERFAAAYGAFAVQVRVNRDDHLARTHQISGVPQLTVNGRFAVAAPPGATFQEQLRIAEGLIARARG